MIIQTTILTRRPGFQYFAVIAICFWLVFSADFALANGNRDPETPPPPPPPPPASCPMQDNVTYYNPNSIGDCIHSQTAQSRTTRYYYPDNRGGCFHWKTITTNFSYQCIKSDYHYDCPSGECSFYLYLLNQYGRGTKSLGLTHYTSTVETWGSASYSNKTFTQQNTYSNIRNHATGISYDAVTRESISEVEDSYLYSDPTRMILRSGGNSHNSLQIEVSRDFALCHSNFIDDFAHPIYFMAFQTSRNIVVSQEMSSNYGQFSYSDYSNEWQRDTITPHNICEAYESYTDFIDPDLEQSGFRYSYETDGNYTGSEEDASSIYDEIIYGR